MLTRALVALALLTLTACDLIDPDADFAFVWSSDDAPGDDGRIHLDPADPLIVRIRLTNPFASPATVTFDRIELRPAPGLDGAETVFDRPDPLPLDPDSSTELRVGEITLLPADECELYAEGIVTADTGEQESFAITSAPIVLAD
ncbi:MAG: hypothetical protein R3F65_30195 [bacterium]